MLYPQFNTGYFQFVTGNFKLLHVTTSYYMSLKVPTSDYRLKSLFINHIISYQQGLFVALIKALFKKKLYPSFNEPLLIYISSVQCVYYNVNIKSQYTQNPILSRGCTLYNAPPLNLIVIVKYLFFNNKVWTTYLN